MCANVDMEGSRIRRRESVREILKGLARRRSGATEGGPPEKQNARALFVMDKNTSKMGRPVWNNYVMDGRVAPGAGMISGETVLSACEA